MVTREQVEAVLMQVRPYMQADGGDIELIEVNGNSAGVRFIGVCSGCPSAAFTLQFGVEMALREAIPEFESVSLV
jgi:Fe-S cluster biogenesis protein NfuA